MHVGFTGTSEGITNVQNLALIGWLTSKLKNKEIYFHHGDCIGADETVHNTCLMLSYKTIIHPPKNPRKRAFCKHYFKIKEEKEYLDRNHDIVNESKFLIACPKEKEEQLRSGTWATIRYARKTKKPIVVFFPDGSFKENY